MKKILVILLTLIVLAGAFAACSNDKPKNEETTNAATTKTITTDEAKITEADAINLIQSYSNKELGLSDEDAKKCSFLVKNSGIKYKDNYYVNVIATIKTAHEDTTDKDGKKITTYTFDNKGEYFIRYDGKEILAKNGDGEYRKLKVKAVPTTTTTTTQETTKKKK